MITDFDELSKISKGTPTQHISQKYEEMLKSGKMMYNVKDVKVAVGSISDYRQHRQLHCYIELCNGYIIEVTNTYDDIHVIDLIFSDPEKVYYLEQIAELDGGIRCIKGSSSSRQFEIINKYGADHILECYKALISPPDISDQSIVDTSKEITKMSGIYKAFSIYNNKLTVHPDSSISMRLTGLTLDVSYPNGINWKSLVPIVYVLSELGRLDIVMGKLKIEFLERT